MTSTNPESCLLDLSNMTESSSSTTATAAPPPPLLASETSPSIDLQAELFVPSSSSSSGTNVSLRPTSLLSRHIHYWFLVNQQSQSQRRERKTSMFKHKQRSGSLIIDRSCAKIQIMTQLLRSTGELEQHSFCRTFSFFRHLIALLMADTSQRERERTIGKRKKEANSRRKEAKTRENVVRVSE